MTYMHPIYEHKVFGIYTYTMYAKFGGHISATYFVITCEVEVAVSSLSEILIGQILIHRKFQYIGNFNIF